MDHTYEEGDRVMSRHYDAEGTVRDLDGIGGTVGIKWDDVAAEQGLDYEDPDDIMPAVS